MIEEIFSRNEINLEDVKYIVPHQANGRIVDHLSRSFKTNKVFSNIEKYGNTTSATIPIALSEIDIEKGDKHGNPYNEDQIEWFKYGSALNQIASVT